MVQIADLWAQTTTIQFSEAKFLVQSLFPTIPHPSWPIASKPFLGWSTKWLFWNGKKKEEHADFPLVQIPFWWNCPTPLEEGMAVRDKPNSCLHCYYTACKAELASVLPLIGDKNHWKCTILIVGEISMKILPSASQDGEVALNPRWFPPEEIAVALEGNSWDASSSQSQ